MMYVRNQFMGITLLFCWIQILDFLAFHPLFGPWAIIIGECLLDVGKFVVVLSLFVFGYAMLGASMNQPFGLPSDYVNDPELNPDNLTQTIRITSPKGTKLILEFYVSSGILRE